MSRAFIRESDDQWLNEIAPTMNALVTFLTRENNGVRVYLQRSFFDDEGREIHVMSNGLSYTHDNAGAWMIV